MTLDHNLAVFTFLFLNVTGIHAVRLRDFLGLVLYRYRTHEVDRREIRLLFYTNKHTKNITNPTFLHLFS